MASSPAIEVELFAMTEVGLVREHNEDAVLVGDLDSGSCLSLETLDQRQVAGRGLLLVVCDGMGGAVGGEVASKLAAEVVWREMRDARPTEERAVYARHLRRAIRAAHQALLEEGRRRSDLRGMGTTVSAAGMVGNVLVVAQVGDSRAYVERHGTLTQVTRDQSVVSALVHAGRLSESEARYSDQRSLILQALGSGPDVDVALSIVELRRGDRLLLCTDGLHGPVADLAMRYTLGAKAGVEDACRALIALSKQAGGPDNATAIVARFGGEALGTAGPDELPRFAEFDPRGDEDAVADTSWVARRLAVKAGLRDGTMPPMVPATGQHRVVRLPVADDAETPPTVVAAQPRRGGLVAWVVVVALVLGLAAAAHLLLDLP